MYNLGCLLSSQACRADESRQVLSHQGQLFPGRAFQQLVGVGRVAGAVVAGREP